MGVDGPRTHRKNKSSKVPWKHWALGWLGKVSKSKRQRPSLTERSWFLGLLGC